MPERVERFVRSRAFAILVGVAALVTRLGYNVLVHPPSEHVYSDMRGYVERADSMFDALLVRDGWSTFYPWGTHTLLFAIERVFGRNNLVAADLVYALLGALLVVLTHALARRVFDREGDERPRPLLGAIVAVIALAYYPWISLGGYFLSEIPFACCLTAAGLLSLRLADSAIERRRDAWMLGAVLGVGAIFRPQILVSVVLIVIWSVRRGLPRISAKSLGHAAIPFALVLALSSARFYATTGHLGLVSTNGTTNLVFGRCHNVGLLSVARDRKNYFGPTSFRALDVYARDHYVLLDLDPAIGREIEVQGHLWDKGPIDAVLRRCLASTSILRQAKYSLTNVMLLWIYNSIWPDTAEDQASGRMYYALGIYVPLFIAPTLLGMAISLLPSRRRFALLALHLFALVITAAIYFGDARFRVPYEAFAFILAVDVIDATAGSRAVRIARVGLRRLRRRANRRARVRSGGVG